HAYAQAPRETLRGRRGRRRDARADHRERLARRLRPQRQGATRRAACPRRYQGWCPRPVHGAWPVTDTDKPTALDLAMEAMRLPKGYDPRNGPDMPPEDCEVIDPALADYVGYLAWMGIAWRPKDRSHPYYAGWEAYAAERDREQRDRAARQYVDALPARYRAYTLDALRVHPGNQAAIDAA